MVWAAVYLLTQNITAVRCVFLFSLFVLLCVLLLVLCCTFLQSSHK